MKHRLIAAVVALTAFTAPAVAVTGSAQAVTCRERVTVTHTARVVRAHIWLNTCHRPTRAYGVYNEPGILRYRYGVTVRGTGYSTVYRPYRVVSGGYEIGSRFHPTF